MELSAIINLIAISFLAIGLHGQSVSGGKSAFPKFSFKKTAKDALEEIPEYSDDVIDLPDDLESEDQLGLLLSSPTWDDSNLASAVLFLEEFCREVRGDKFDEKLSGKHDGKLKGACVALSGDLQFFIWLFTPRYGPGTVEERKKITKNIYEGKLEAEKFDKYAKWLKKNIPGAIESLIKMHNESVKMTKDQMKNDTTAGPLKYGFVINQMKNDTTAGRLKSGFENIQRWGMDKFFRSNFMHVTKNLIAASLPNLLMSLGISIDASSIGRNASKTKFFRS